jgi:trans-aconitate methyltransferase
VAGLHAEFFELHRDLPREGPGSAAEVDWVLGQIPAPASVLDLACGPGADTLTLAQRLLAARIEGVDITPHLVAAARERLHGFAPRVSVREGDMLAIEGRHDLIWCMGALYGPGLERALPIWREHLAPGGVVAFSEPVLVSDPPHPVARAFWAEYPGVGTEARIAARIEGAGFRVLATRRLTGRPWAEYYEPMAKRIELLRPRARFRRRFKMILDAGALEISQWRQAPDEIAYLLSIAAPA